MLPASYTIIRPGLIRSAIKRFLLSAALALKGLLVPQWVLFEAVADFIISWLIAANVNRAAQRCYERSARPWAPSERAAEQPAGIAVQAAERTSVGPTMTALSRAIEWLRRLWRSAFGRTVEVYELVISPRPNAQAPC